MKRLKIILLTLSIMCLTALTASAATPVSENMGVGLVDMINGVTITNGEAGDVYPGGFLRIPEVEFGNGAFEAVTVEYAVDNGYGGGTISVYADAIGGTLIAELYAPDTGGWSAWKTVMAEPSNPYIQGTHDLYITFSKRSMCTFKSVGFKRATIASSDGGEVDYSQQKLVALGIIDAIATADRTVKNSDVIEVARRASKNFYLTDEQVMEELGVNVEKEASLNDIAKVFVYSAGYMLPDESIESYEARSLKLASELKIFSKVKFENGKIKYFEFLKCIDNFLEAKTAHYDPNGKIYKSENSVLNDCMGIYKGRDIVRSDSVTAIVGGPKLDSVLIGDYVYSKNGVESDLYFGQNVEFYYRDNDGDFELLYIMPFRNEIVTVTASEAKGLDSLRFTYDDGIKEQTLKIAQNFIFVYNNLVVSDFEESIFSDFNGTLKLIDNNSDGKFDVLIMSDYYNIIVDSYADEVIYGRTNDLPGGKDKYILDLKDKEFTVRSVVGKKMDEEYLSNIKAGSIISVMHSIGADGSEAYDITLSNMTVFGRAERISEGNDATLIRINGEDYRVSKSADELGEGYIGQRIVLHLDHQREIVYVVAKKYDTKYGYTVSYYYDDAEDILYVKIFGEDGTMNMFTADKKLRIDAKTYKDVKRKAAIEHAFKESVVTYTVNEQGLLSEIDFPYNYDMFDTPVGKNEKESINSLFISYNGSAFYRWYGRSFSGKSVLDSSSIVFCIPNDGDTSKYRVENAEYYFEDQGTYNIMAYGVDTEEYRTPVYSVKYDKIASFGETDRVVFVSDIRINEIYDNNKDEALSEISYYLDGKLTKAIVDPELNDTINKINIGDVIRVRYNFEGRINNIEQVFNINKIDSFTNRGVFNSGNRYVMDRVKKINGSYAILSGNGEIVSLLTNNICIYDSEARLQNRVRTAQLDEIVGSKFLGESTRVFISQYYGQVNGVYIIK